ncbi:transposase [Acinetobacter johnsonii]|uniref:transposase n=1 Tax=Acinetobacter johnsonii TaxID=40214 RepID=UPI0032B48AE9
MLCISNLCATKPVRWPNLNKKVSDKPGTVHPVLKQHNREINKRRIGIEHVFGVLKTFKILSERYRNRGKRLGLRFNLIAGIYNLELNER